MLAGGRLELLLNVFAAFQHEMVPRDLPRFGFGAKVLVVFHVLRVKHGLVGLRLAVVHERFVERFVAALEQVEFRIEKMRIEVFV